MAGNNDPIYSRVGAIGLNTGITSAQNTYDGAGANDTLVFTADATNGSFVQRLRFKAKGTNVATVARIYINNGSANTTAANNVFYGEFSLPATTAIATAATLDLDYGINFALPAGWKIYVGLGTAVAAGWTVSTVAGNY